MTTEPTDTKTFSLADHDAELRLAIGNLSDGILDALPGSCCVRAYAAAVVWQKEDGSIGTTTAWGGEGFLIAAGCTDLSRLFNKTLSEQGF